MHFAGLILIMMGVFFLLIVYIIDKYFKELNAKCTHVTKGIPAGVSEREEDPTDMNNLYHEYYPLYKYIVDGKEYFCKGVVGNYNPDQVEHKDVDVYYNPSNPEESYIDKDESNKILGIFKLIGVISILGGLAFFIVDRFI